MAHSRPYLIVCLSRRFPLFQRVWVIIAAIILLAFAIVAVSQCSGKYDAFCYVINIITIVGCIFGIIGACQSTKEHN